MNLDQYLGVFIVESKENLQNLNTHLLELESKPEDSFTINEIFRVAHTLKGMSGTMGFTKMQKLTHSTENVLSEIRSGKIQVSSELLDLLFKCMDALEQYVQNIESTSLEGPEDYLSLISELNKIVNGETITTGSSTVKDEQIVQMDSSQEKAKNKAIDMGMNAFQIKTSLVDDCVLKAPRAFIVFKYLEEMGDVIYSVPGIKEIEDEQFDKSFTAVLLTNETLSEVKKSIENISDIQKVEIIELQKTEENEQTSVSETTDSDLETKVSVEKGETATATNQMTSANKTVRVSIERLDTLMNLLSELIIVKTQLEGAEIGESDGVANFKDSLEYLERVTTNLHDAVMKVRMVPVENVFNRFPRMIRDVSRKLGKEIELTMTGKETELDRTVVDEIGDPLIHLLRNAADHGLETIEERIAAGKPRKGNVYLKAYQDGNNVVIEVEDDGKGLDVEKIKNKAISNGAITPEQALNMSDNDIIQILFRPSFSTADAITDLSGRGVGLDVVKSKITDLGGTIEVKTELGKGSTFIVRLPLTLAIIQALMVKIGQEKYAIPLGNIQTIEIVPKSEIKKVQNQDVIVLRDKVIAIRRLHDILEVEDTNKSENIMVIIVKKNDHYVGFVIDDLIGQQEIVVKSLGKHLSNISMLVGATILGNGEVTLILDINTLI